MAHTKKKIYNWDFIEKNIHINVLYAMDQGPIAGGPSGKDLSEGPSAEVEPMQPTWMKDYVMTDDLFSLKSIEYL